jgi:hypothetical protein
VEGTQTVPEPEELGAVLGDWCETVVDRDVRSTTDTFESMTKLRPDGGDSRAIHGPGTVARKRQQSPEQAILEEAWVVEIAYGLAVALIPAFVGGERTHGCAGRLHAGNPGFRG